MIDWKKICVRSDIKIIDVLQVLNDAGTKIVFVVDQNYSLLGSVTDGDIRRGFLKGVTIQDSVDKIVFKGCQFVKVGTSEDTIEELIEEKSITHLPIVDETHRVKSIYAGRYYQGSAVKCNPVVIMAGGLGSRLGDITKDCPKPLLKVQNKPILEHLIHNLKKHGFKKIFISVNYLSEKIEEHFSDGKKFGVEISYIKEKIRMGTAGSLSLMPEVLSPILLSNGDIITKINYEELLSHHELMGNDITICARKISNTIPFGVLQIEGHEVTAIIEKPATEHIVNAGIYILNPDVIRQIPKDSYFDMPSLINLLLDANYKVGYFLDSNYWVDIGRADDLEKARREVT